MKTRKDITEVLNKFSKDGIEQQIVATVLIAELLLDIRELLIKKDNIETGIRVAKSVLGE